MYGVRGSVPGLSCRPRHRGMETQRKRFDAFESGTGPDLMLHGPEGHGSIPHCTFTVRNISPLATLIPYFRTRVIELIEPLVKSVSKGSHVARRME